MTPIQVLADGTCGIHRGVTTRSLDALSNPNYAVLDTSKVTVCDFIADEPSGQLAQLRGRRPKLASTEGPGRAVPGVTNLAGVKSWVMGILEKWDQSTSTRSTGRRLVHAARLARGPRADRDRARPVDGLYQLDTTIRQTA